MITLTPDQVLDLVVTNKIELTDELIAQIASYYGAVVIDEDDE